MTSGKSSITRDWRPFCKWELYYDIATRDLRNMAKAHEIGTSSIKKSVFCFTYQHGFRNHFNNKVDGKVSRRRIRAYIVLYMWGEYFIDILAHKVGKKPI